jgi:glycerol-3-phosphate dehydrogenase
MSRRSFDLIIIGAGINGAGIARDASMRGLKVLLIDKTDISSGTTSFSTRLIHGGLRYLEHFEFGLVRESLRERENLLRIAPHLVKAIPILIPIYKGGTRGRAAIRAGMIAYDILSFDKRLPRHRMLKREETLAQYHGLNPEGLVGAAIYYDCQVEFPERLVLENILSAKEHGAEVLTYTRVTKLDDGVVEFVQDGHDVETASATVVVNAAGPWIDRVLAHSQTQRLIGGTKGSHIVVDSFPGAPSTAVYVEAESDRRPFFVIPWNHNYLIGTTDVRFENDPDEVRSEMWEVDYLLNETNRVFPDAKLQRSDVCYTYSGVRPLPYTSNEDARKITRRHFIREDVGNRNLLSIIGGKLTTYRSLAEECVDLVFPKLGRKAPQCPTSERPLPGALEPTPPNINLPEVVARRLLKIYGSRNRLLLDLCRDRPELAKPFSKAGDALSAEVVFSFESELAQTLSDCLLRRTMLGLNRDLAIGDDEAAAEIGKQFLGWSDERAQHELNDYRKDLKRMRLV